MIDNFHLGYLHSFVLSPSADAIAGL